MRQVIIYRGEDGYWIAECPSLPGCISQGKTKKEALFTIQLASKVRDAVRKSLIEAGLELPEMPIDES